MVRKISDWANNIIEELSYRRNVSLGKSPSGKCLAKESSSQKVSVGKISLGDLSFGRCYSGNCQVGKISYNRYFSSRDVSRFSICANAPSILISSSLAMVLSSSCSILNFVTVDFTSFPFFTEKTQAEIHNE